MGREKNGRTEDTARAKKASASPSLSAAACRFSLCFPAVLDFSKKKV